MDHGFNREESELGFPLCEYHRLPKPPDATISVRERVDELDFIMHRRAGEQGVEIRAFHPSEEVFHQTRHSFGRWCHVDQPLALIDSHASRPETPSIIC